MEITGIQLSSTCSSVDFVGKIYQRRSSTSTEQPLLFPLEPDMRMIQVY